jgi:hypothetical protein
MFRVRAPRFNPFRKTKPDLLGRAALAFPRRIRKRDT